MNQDQQNARDHAHMQAQQNQRDKNFNDMLHGQNGIVTGSMHNEIGLMDRQARQRQAREQAEQQEARRRESQQKAQKKAAAQREKSQAKVQAKSKASARPRSTAADSSFFPEVDAWFNEYIGGGRRVAVNMASACLLGLTVYGYTLSANYSTGSGVVLAGLAALLGLLTMRLVIFATKLLTLSLVLGVIGGVCYGAYAALTSGG